MRMHRTKANWEEQLNKLRSVSDKPMAEIKGGELYRGNAAWRQWDGGERSALIDQIIEWMRERKHNVTFGAVSQSRLVDMRDQFDLGGLQKASGWCVAASQLLLGIQKNYQGNEKNKGNTVFVFDNASELGEIIDFVVEPPRATDGFYNRKKNQDALDQIIDVPYSADSRHIGLIQVADVFAFILRLYAELTEGLQSEKFDGELQRLRRWIEQMKPLFLSNATRWPAGSKDPCINFFHSVAPPSLLKIPAA